MKIWNEILSNQVLVSAVAGWIVAQVLKTMLDFALNRTINWERMVGSGGMPSSHSATVCGLTTAAALHYGVSSFEFAVCFVLSMVVMYDARGVRRAAGEQAEAINELREKISEDQVEEDPFPEWGKPLREALGHKPTEVISGAILGIAVSFLAF